MKSVKDRIDKTLITNREIQNKEIIFMNIKKYCKLSEVDIVSTISDIDFIIKDNLLEITRRLNVNIRKR